MRDTTQVVTVTKVKLAPKMRDEYGRFKPGPVPKFYVGQRVYEIGFIGECEVIRSCGWDDHRAQYPEDGFYRYHVRQCDYPHRELSVPESSLRTLAVMRRYFKSRQATECPS